MNIAEVFCLAFFVLISCWYSEAKRRHGICFVKEEPKHKKDMFPCTKDEFRCSNGHCIDRRNYCNGVKDCRDGSDEAYCKTDSSCPTGYESCTLPGLPPWIPKARGCLPDEFFCDGYVHCEEDEMNCVGPQVSKLSKDVQNSLEKTVRWVKTNSKSTSATEKWGSLVHKKAVALFLGDGMFPKEDDFTTKEISYEIALKLLSLLSRSKLQDIPSTELASLVNALLVTCSDPRNFYGHNLIDELRSRPMGLNYTNPYVFLTLCNAGESITESDREKLVSCFWNERRGAWTDMKALVVMALSCARNQFGSVVSQDLLQELTTDLKNHQYRNGTVENLQTTALVLQALYAAEPTDDPDSFDEEKALQQILQDQKLDGSFGNFMKTYYVLPILNCRSLVNISSHHCPPPPRDEETAEQYLLRQKGPKIHTEYSIWVGNERYMERTMALKLPMYTSLYKMMEIASDLDDKFKFEYVVKNRKPYVNGLSGLLDDPEDGRFWFLYVLNATQPILVNKSPAEIILKDKDHFVMWYRRGPWTESSTPDIENNVEPK